MLQSMHAKGAAEKAAEAQTFAEYSEFCHNMTRDKKYAIGKAEEEIEMLSADIQKAESDSAVCARKMAKLDEKIAGLNAKKEEANAENKKARADYLTEHKDFSDSIDALDRGIQQIQSGAFGLVQGGRNATSLVHGGQNSTKSKEALRKRQEALLQLQKAAKMPLHAKRVLVAFLDSREEPEEEVDTRGVVETKTDDEIDRIFESDAKTGHPKEENPLDTVAPEATSYGFQSGGVVMMLRKLWAKFKKELHDCEQEELRRKADYDSVIMDLNNQIQVTQESWDAESATKGARDQTAAEKKGLLADTKKAKADDEEYLATLTSECEMAASDFESRQQLRTEELAAIAKATEIISSGAVSGSADKHLPSLLQGGQAAAGTEACTTELCKKSLGLSLAFLRSTPKGPGAKAHATGKSPNTKSISKFLEHKAAKTGSKLLSLVARKVGAIGAMPNIPGVTPLDMGEDPIGEVKKMMKDMILQLMDQANEEASQRGWCTTELGTNKQTRDEKTDGVTKLTTEKDKLGADVAKLGEEIAELTKAIAEIDGAMAQATLTRNEEKSTNKETIADAEEAQTAVSNALTILKEFYQKAATATALVQAAEAGDDDGAFMQAEPKTNPFAENTYTGMGSESTGVVGMLEVIASDFARLESETEMAEEQAAKEFQRFSDMSATDKAVKNQEMSDKTNLQTSKKVALKSTEKDLTNMQKQLDTALAYYDKLKPACIYTGESYAERVARRNAEIEGLEEALRFFEGQDLPPM
jgi:predicted  nucleic acid-binding Zn-ribbon protein